MKKSINIIGITTSPKPTKKTLFLLKDLTSIVPASKYYKRQSFKIRQIIFYLKSKGFKNLLLFKEKKENIEMWQFNFKEKVTLSYQINHVILRKILDLNGSHSNHRPEIILNNFNGKIGQLISFMIKELFVLKPDFQGRQVLSFHYANGLIFIRYHRYIFSFSGKDVKLQEMGPRITMRLLRIFEKIPINFFGL